MADLVTLTPAGLYCPAGDFYIDPWRPVGTALITHAHGDHARSGSSRYLCAAPNRTLLGHRIGEDNPIIPYDYGTRVTLGDVEVSFHSAGHILGSAQIRIEGEDGVWVVSGDYKRADDPTCEPFEVVKCDTFITEATFSLPIYRWPSGESVAREVLAWWEQCIAQEKTAMLFCYSLGKAQRVLAELAKLTDRTVYIHGAMEVLTTLYRNAGVPMLPTQRITEADKGTKFAGQLVLAPPSAYRSPWMKRFPKHEAAFASGWMRVRGNRRRRGYDRGFVISDHVDWPDLIRTIEDTGAKRILATHGNTDTLVRYLNSRGWDAAPLRTDYGEEDEE